MLGLNVTIAEQVRDCIIGGQELVQGSTASVVYLSKTGFLRLMRDKRIDHKVQELVGLEKLYDRLMIMSR